MVKGNDELPPLDDDEDELLLEDVLLPLLEDELLLEDDLPPLLEDELLLEDDLPPLLEDELLLELEEEPLEPEGELPEPPPPQALRTITPAINK